MKGLPPFPRGFIWSQGRIKVPDGWSNGPIDDLFLSRDNIVSHAKSGNASVTVIGLCTAIRPGIVDIAKFLLSEFIRGEGEFFDAVDILCGRFVIFLAEPGRTRIVADATAMRTVFYRDDFGAVASHARLIAEEAPNDLPFRYGYPGNGTPFAHVKLLTPNTLIDLRENRLRCLLARPPYRGAITRFWPRGPIPFRSPEEAASIVMDGASTAVRTIAASFPLRMALTAGLDSRALLSVMLNSGVEFESYTYVSRLGPTALDAAVAGELARHVGVKHSTITTAPPSPALRDALQSATYASHHFFAVEPLREWIGGSGTVALTANLLEIGRCFYAKHCGLSEPVTSRAMRYLHFRTMPRNSQEEIEKYGIRRYAKIAERSFSDFSRASNFSAARGILDSFDQFYWEHRMAAWHGLNMLERDFYAQAYIPFNARTLWAALLGVERDKRISADAFVLFVEQHGLNAIPVNPKEWPLAA